MKPLGDQVYDKLVARIGDGEVFAFVASNFAEALMDGAKDRTQRGEALPNAKYNNRYEDRQASKHGRRSPVTLRDTHASMRGMHPDEEADGAIIRGSEKLYWHDTGEAKGGKIRQMFPRNINQVPKPEMEQFIKDIGDVLNGKSIKSNKESTSGRSG